jgi:hypothetical protein
VYTILVGNFKGKKHFGDLHVDVRVTLTQILKKNLPTLYRFRLDFTGLWDPEVGSCDHSNKNLVSVIAGNFLIS